MKLSPVEVSSLRFNNSMNILQAACFFSSENIVKYLKDLLKKEDTIKKALSYYQEPGGGNNAIHFAVLKGNQRIVDTLISDFDASHLSLTSNGLTVLHCAA